MTIENLLKVIPPPAEPFEAFLGTWELIEGDLGTRLPQDYKDFVRLYGSGRFLEFMGVDVPRSRNPNLRLETKVYWLCHGLGPLEFLPHPMWPAEGGMIPFGGTDNGDYLLWIARGAPDDWPVAIWNLRDGAFEVIERDLTDFLAGLATGEITTGMLPSDLLPCDRPFRPHSARPNAPSDVVRDLSGTGKPDFGPLRTRLKFPIRPPF
ncbi:SMI1/KNR4 family protein [Phenylobacterium aquaticum]|uniref:SMI1/KNR4 family protein n=1 Tax=Phenylobacterium aquaticum TaxID=1763816 RepID=UPI0026F275BF|nr:SMI1/KNR4 family protein [Phenylobacterium aquaticum]